LNGAGPIEAAWSLNAYIAPMRASHE